MLDAFPLRAQPTGLVAVVIRLVGAGAAIPTVAMGPKGEPATSTSSPGVTTTRAGVGDYSVVFPELPGTLVGWQATHGHTTPTAGTSRIVQIDPDSMTAVTKALRFLVSDVATPTVAELTTAETVTLMLIFKQTGKGV